jgi:hypothetical protein
MKRRTDVDGRWAIPQFTLLPARIQNHFDKIWKQLFTISKPMEQAVELQPQRPAASIQLELEHVPCWFRWLADYWLGPDRARPSDPDAV